jgi:predicted Zn-dependent protease
LGQRVADSRVTISHDPSDPLLGVRPFSSDGDPHRRVTWIENGVLTALSYDRDYALSQLYENLALPNSGAFRMSGGTTTIDEMIQSTKRGLLITRLSNFGSTDYKSLLTSAYTRDGIWLIENGKIAKPVKNFRVTESPLFLINRIEALGVPVPAYSPWRPIVVPPLLVRDFNCTSLADAV